MQSPEILLKKALEIRSPAIGCWIQTNAPSAAEIMANAGFSWLGLDCEHTSADIKTVEEVARALHGRNTALLVRVSSADALEIRRSLDVGAHGVIVPLIDTPEQARAAVAAAKYPPEGCRGFCFARMNNWGVDFENYAHRANATTIVIAMIESRKGVEAIDEILAVPGLDGVFIGPYDLSGSYGVPGQTRHPIVNGAGDRILAACEKHQKAAGCHLVRTDPAQIQQALEKGFTFVCLDADIILIDRGAREVLKSARSTIAKSTFK